MSGEMMVACFWKLLPFFSASIVNFRRSILHVACFILIAAVNFLIRFLSPSKNSREKKKIGRKDINRQKKKDEVKKTCLLCGRKEIERTIFQVFTLLVAMNYPLHHTFLPHGKILRDVVNGMRRKEMLKISNFISYSKL